MARAVAWLVVGLGLLVLMVAALAPIQAGMQALAIAGVMVVPGVLVLLVAGQARRRREHEEE